MVCVKCGYDDHKHEVKRFDKALCAVCATFAPSEEASFLKYIAEKIDWKVIDTFRMHGEHRGSKQKKGMKVKAQQGTIMTRAPFGYSISNGTLIPNEDSIKVSALFQEVLETNETLGSIAVKYNFSITGLKKILKNRTYLGEIKFDRELHKGTHKPLVSPEVFYAVQRALHTKLRPRDKKKGTVKPLEVENSAEQLFSDIIESEPDELYSAVFDQ